MKNEGSVKFTIKANSINPEGELIFTAIGIGKDKREAGILAFGMTCSALTSEEEDIKDIENLEEAMDAISKMSIDIEGDINKLVNDQMEKDYFSAHDTSSKIDLSFEDLNETEKIGGFLNDLIWLEKEF
jgi:hypothetical protein